MAFYTPPSPLPAGTHGDLIWYRQAALGAAGTLDADGWNVLYHSVDATGADNVVTGTVLIPKAAWSGKGARPVIGYAVGTHGLAQSCAPSLQLAGGTDYETANLAAALKQGYAVLVTDNPGYTTGDTPTYLAGQAQGHALLDLFKAATQIPSIPLSANAEVAIWGYSQGGQTAAWAGQLQPSYAPGLDLVGVAAGGVPADFITTAAYLNGSAGASFLLGGVIGLSAQYPQQIPLDSLANAQGKAAIAKGKSECVFSALFDFMNKDISEYTVGNQTLQQLEAVPSINQVLVAQNLGGGKMPVPLYEYMGQADEFIPLDQAETLKQTYCDASGNVTFALYPSEHIVTQFQAAPDVLAWLGDRFAGKSVRGTCRTRKPRPQSTANPGGGDFVVSLDQWPLNATVHLAGSGCGAAGQLDVFLKGRHDHADDHRRSVDSELHHLAEDLPHSVDGETLDRSDRSNVGNGDAGQRRAAARARPCPRQHRGQRRRAFHPAHPVRLRDHGTGRLPDRLRRSDLVAG
jgi:dienelactone hydrolase